VPLAWIMLAAMECENDISALWGRVKARCHSLSLGWASKAHKVLDQTSPDGKVGLKEISSGVQHASNMKLVALELPAETLSDASRQEEHALDTRVTEISNVEHLFQRLNSGGTRLDGEELAYSMIKAYWPEVEDPIRRLSERRMPESRLVMLGARVAIAKDDDESKGLPRVLDVSQLRRIARGGVKTDENAKASIMDLFLGAPTSKLETILQTISTWLDYQPAADDIGIPPVLHSSIARGSPDVYLWLMWMARQRLDGKLSKEEDGLLRKRLLGMATSVHWFGTKNKSRAIDLLVRKMPKSEFSRGYDFHGLLAGIAHEEDGQVTLNLPLAPNEIEELIWLPNSKETLETWSFWGLVKGDSEKEKNVWPVIAMLKESRELLLFAQREYLVKAFKGYDPARLDMWERHDRPWDYDHLVASKKVYYQRGEALPAIREWAYSIANLRAVPMADNRSDQDISPAHKLKADGLENSFLLSDEFNAFEDVSNDVHNTEKALAFVGAAKRRLLRIYCAWYDTLDIGLLTAKK
jgi:hypothetical protein